jgi:hypothetical protein
LIEKIRKRVAGVLTAEKYVMVEYNIRKDKLHQASLVTPGYSLLLEILKPIYYNQRLVLFTYTIQQAIPHNYAFGG